MTPFTIERENVNEPEVLTSSRITRLSGWAGIEEHFMRHDTGMMRDSTDDIDTLLVFAALFSAILTTFAVQTYQLLQSGDSSITNQLIAYQISTQGNHANMPSAINSTISSLLFATPTAPTASARWVNVLFFFSLVLSLAAALLGIMAKQWIREYMKWNAPLPTPRENVLLRQIRFENWDKWSVEAFIWSIPSLLELAMVLFLAGVVILLWTLDNIVAIAVTALVSCFLSVVSVITILPIFLKHCPYKSPTAWAFLRLWNTANSFLLRGYALLRRQEAEQSNTNPVHYQTWRAKDLIHGWDTSPEIVSTRWELARERTHLTPGGSDSEEPALDAVSHRTAEYFLHDLSEIRVLLRALDWVATASQDEHVDHCVSQCLATLHHTWAKSTRHCDIPSARALALWSVMASWTNSQRIAGPRAPTSIDTAIDHPRTAHPFSPRRMRALLGIVVETSEVATGSTFRFGPNFAPASVDIPFNDRIFRYLAAELHWAVAAPTWLKHSLQPRRVFEIVSVMVYMVFKLSGGPTRAFRADTSLHGLRAILKDDDIDSASTISTKTPGLRSLAFWLISHHAKFTVSHGTSIEICPGLSETGNFETLLEGYLGSFNLTGCVEDDISIVVIAGIQWLCKSSITKLCTRVHLMRLVQRAFNAAFERDTKIYLLLSYWTDFEPWVDRLLPWDSAQDMPTEYVSACGGLLHSLHRYYVHGMIQSEGNYLAHELHVGLMGVHHIQPSCEIPDCPWVGHNCHEPWKCPLLELHIGKCSCLPYDFNIPNHDMSSSTMELDVEGEPIHASGVDAPAAHLISHESLMPLKPAALSARHRSEQADEPQTQGPSSIPHSYPLIPHAEASSSGQPANSWLTRNNAITERLRFTAKSRPGIGETSAGSASIQGAVPLTDFIA